MDCTVAAGSEVGDAIAAAGESGIEDVAFAGQPIALVFGDQQASVICLKLDRGISSDDVGEIVAIETFCRRIARAVLIHRLIVGGCGVPRGVFDIRWHKGHPTGVLMQFITKMKMKHVPCLLMLEGQSTFIEVDFDSGTRCFAGWRRCVFTSTDDQG